MSIVSLISKIPKVEIHIHLEAVASIKTLLKLNRKYGVLKNIENENEFSNYIFVETLSEMIGNFFDLQKLFRNLEDYAFLAEDVLEYMIENRVDYLEGFISPSMVKNLGFVAVQDFYAIWDQNVREIESLYNKKIRLIVDLSRSFGPENAMDNLNTVKSYIRSNPETAIIGLGLGGLEIGNPARDYYEVFKKAKDTGFHLVAHAGEEVGPESIVEALDLCSAERIGHGTSAIYDEDVMKMLRDRDIPLEICVTSNVFTKKYVSEFSNHPIGKFIEYGIPVTVNTDDPVLFGTNLNREYTDISTYCGLDDETIIKLLKNNVDYSFMPDDQKREFWQTKASPLIANQ
ncbi:Adenosine deaminase [Olavius algarvensis spirochete endosymbiont]|uniref:adenosine deaminase n=1 Tax=Olavius algarvensis spirochete endosymbiont TaxID=260710 RepID=UPI000F1C7782|nr:adenosine deaminase [Olavius algarvensis spirochete endosymbiont]VDB00742.1 Adenosine deaminase [Olavius algarvensis spirochete endosymbiont]